MRSNRVGPALRYFGAVVLATGPTSFALALLTYYVYVGALPPSDSAHGTGFALLIVHPFIGAMFLTVAALAWALAVTFSLPVLRGRRVWASVTTVLAVGVAAVFLAGTFAPQWILHASVLSLPLGLALCVGLPGLRRDVRPA